MHRTGSERDWSQGRGMCGCVPYQTEKCSYVGHKNSHRGSSVAEANLLLLRAFSQHLLHPSNMLSP